jgi:hypothetical protein
VALIHDFFREIDGGWTGAAPEKIRLCIIGCSALMLRTGYVRGTKDSDVLETRDLTEPVKKRLLALAGPGTDLHKKYGMYIELVPNGLPFLPQVALYHEDAALHADLKHFELAVLDVVDVVVSKLARFHSDDRSDIEAMIDRDMVSHERLVARFREAVDYHLGDARAEDLPRYCRNLNTVERDMLGVPETLIELPEWLDR